MVKNDLQIVGKSLPRVDGVAKVLGTAKYTADYKRPDMLIGKALYSKHPHALIKGIDISRAAALAGVVTVMTARDLPGRNAYGFLVPDKPVIADVKVRYEGDVVALVAAVNAEIAQQALDLIEVDYELLPVYDDPREAMKEDSVLIHDTHPIQDKGNRLQTVVIDRGNVEKAFAEADIIIENDFETPIIDHGYLEPDSCIAEPDPLTGGLTLINAQQGVTNAKRALAPVFGLPHNKVRIISPLLGGGFGGKECAGLDVCVVAGVLALKTRRPVFFELSREDIFRTTSKRHASYIKYRMAATLDGKITAIDVDAMYNKGAYLSLSGGRPPLTNVIGRSAERAGGCYAIPNAKVRAYSVFTNHPYAGACRGFGAPQTNYAVECQLDDLARRLNIDPVELRRRNMLRHGDAAIYGQVMLESRGLGLPECIEKVTQAIGWNTPIVRGSGAVKRGRGFAALMYGTSGASASDGAGCYANLEHDGTIIVSVASSEMGSGLITALAQIAAETLGVKFTDVAINFSDTGSSPDAGPTVASRGVTFVGNAVADACGQLKARMLAVAAGLLGEEPQDLDIKNGRVYAVNRPEKTESLAAVIVKAFRSQIPLATFGCWYPPPPSFRAEDGQGDPHHTYTFGAQAVEIEVDTETGMISLLRSVIACDVGKAINPAGVEGQMEGGVAQSAGWALMEEIVMNKGVMENTAFHNYLIPTMKDLPDLESIIVEHPNELGPFGAKGVGEPPILATAPAIRNALYDALGFAVNTIPLTPRVVLAAIKEHAKGKA